MQPVAAAEANKPQPPAADAKSDEGKKARDENPMGWAGLTFKLGFAGIHSSDLPNPTYRPDLAESLSMLPQEQREQYGFGSSCSVITERCKLDGRYGLRLALAINLGGDGFGWDIEPYLALSSMAKAYGIYTGPKFDIHILDSLYVGFGLGLKGAWLVTDDWDFGADLYARLPLRATWYAVDNLALVFEFAFSVGASGYISQAETVTNPITGSEFRTSPEMNFGAGKAWDASVGFRFP